MSTILLVIGGFNRGDEEVEEGTGTGIGMDEVEVEVEEVGRRHWRPLSPPLRGFESWI